MPGQRIPMIEFLCLFSSELKLPLPLNALCYNLAKENYPENLLPAYPCFWPQTVHFVFDYLPIIKQLYVLVNFLCNFIPLLWICVSVYPCFIFHWINNQSWRFWYHIIRGYHNKRMSEITTLRSTWIIIIPKYLSGGSTSCFIPSPCFRVACRFCHWGQLCSEVSQTMLFYWFSWL